MTLYLVASSWFSVHSQTLVTSPVESFGSRCTKVYDAIGMVPFRAWAQIALSRVSFMRVP